MDIAMIVNLIKLMTFAEVGSAYVGGLIDDDAYDAYGYVWASSADRGKAYAHFLEYPTSERGHEIAKALIQASPHPYAGAY